MGEYEFLFTFYEFDGSEMPDYINDDPLTYTYESDAEALENLNRRSSSSSWPAKYRGKWFVETLRRKSDGVVLGTAEGIAGG